MCFHMLGASIYIGGIYLTPGNGQNTFVLVWTGMYLHGWIGTFDSDR